MIYRKSYNSRKHHDSRTIPVPGQFEDNGLYFRCWNCGFINKDGREELAGDNAPDGSATIDYSSPSMGMLEPNGDIMNLFAVLDSSIDFYQVLFVPGQDGTPIPIISDLMVTGTGCPLCHTRNWKGQH